MSAAFSVSVWRGEGWQDALRAASAADHGRAPPLFATETTRLHTENRTRGALQFFTKFIKSTLINTKIFLTSRLLCTFDYTPSPTKLKLLSKIWYFFQDTEKIHARYRHSEVFLIKMACRLGGRSGNGQWGRYPLSGTRARPSLPSALRHRVRKFQKWIVENTNTLRPGSEHRTARAGADAAPPWDSRRSRGNHAAIILLLPCRINNKSVESFYIDVNCHPPVWSLLVLKWKLLNWNETD